MLSFLPLILPVLFGALLKVYDDKRRLKYKKRVSELPKRTPVVARKSLPAKMPGKVTVVDTPPNGISSPHSKAEEKCRVILESLYSVKFPPHEQFVINPRTGKWLTLDGYNPSLKIAFEYQGPQHYDFPNYLSRQGRMTRKQFDDGKWRDWYKKKACERVGIKLLIIPHTEERRLEQYIKSIAPMF